MLAAILLILPVAPFPQPNSIAPSPAPIAIDLAHLVPVRHVPDFDREVLTPLRAAQTQAARKAAEEAKRVEAVQREQHAQAAKEAQEALEAPQAAPVQARQPVPATSGSHQDWMAAAGISPSDYGFVDYIITKESGWNPTAQNPSGATGLPQALPYSKTGCAWGDAVCQLRWASGYATSRYGSWAGAYAFWLANHWW